MRLNKKYTINNYINNEMLLEISSSNKRSNGYII